jgi:opacity protein-like surface antigen
MKTKSIACTCFLLAAGSPLFAGEYVAPASASASAPAPTYESYNWFLGGGGEYLFDAEEDYWNAHVGFRFSDVSSIFLEVGWVGNESQNSTADFDVDIVPITLNYKYQGNFSGSLGWYIGVGAGAAFVDINLDSPATGEVQDDEWSFTFQAFTGLVYEFSPSFEMYLGVRYLWVDESELFGFDVDTVDDVSLGLGMRFNF